MPAAAAGIGEDAVICFGRLHCNGSVVPIVAKGVCVTVDVLIAAGAFVERVPLFSTGRGNDGFCIRVRMADRGNHLRFGLSAACTGVGFFTVLRIGRFQCYNAFIPCMVECRCKCVLIRFAATGAGVGRAAAGCAGRFGYDCAVAVPQSRNFAALDIAAAGTSAGLQTVFGTGCSLCEHPIAIGVAERCSVVVHVTVAAGAGVNGVALLRTGGRNNCDGILMVVAKGCNGFCPCLRTARTGVKPQAAGGLGRFNRNDAVIPCVAKFCCIGIIIGMAASGAGMCCVAALCAGRCGYGCGIIVSERGNLARLNIVAARAGAGFKSARHTGRLLDAAPSAVIMPQCGNKAVLIRGIAARANVGGVAAGGAGGSGDGRSVAVA